VVFVQEARAKVVYTVSRGLTVGGEMRDSTGLGQSPMEDRVSVPVATVNKVLTYLGGKPFVDVASLISELQRECRPLVDDSKQAKELVRAAE
jgi:hypothetical protein